MTGGPGYRGDAECNRSTSCGQVRMAIVAARISTVWHGLSLLSSLAKLRCVSNYIECTTSRPVVMPDGAACPSVVIMGGQSFKLTERGGARGFDAHKRVEGRKRHILVDTFGLLVANRVDRLTHPIGVRALCCLAD
jgi:hypothetical protein